MTFQYLEDAKMRIQHRKLRKNSQRGKRRAERETGEIPSNGEASLSRRVL